MMDGGFQAIMYCVAEVLAAKAVETHPWFPALQPCRNGVAEVLAAKAVETVFTEWFKVVIGCRRGISR